MLGVGGGGGRWEGRLRRGDGVRALSAGQGGDSWGGRGLVRVRRGVGGETSGIDRMIKS